MKKLNKEIEFAIAGLADRSGTISPQAKHEIQMHFRELLAIKRDHLKSNLNKVTHTF